MDVPSHNPATQEQVMGRIFPSSSTSPFRIQGFYFTPEACTQNARRLYAALPSVLPQFIIWPAFRSLSPSVKFRLDMVHFENLHSSHFEPHSINNWKKLVYAYAANGKLPTILGHLVFPNTVCRITLVHLALDTCHLSLRRHCIKNIPRGFCRLNFVVFHIH